MTTKTTYLKIPASIVLGCILALPSASVSQESFQPQLSVVFDKGINQLSVTKLGGLRAKYSPFDGEVAIKPGKAALFPACPNEGFYRIDDGIKGHVVFISRKDSAQLMLTRIKGIDAKFQKGDVPLKIYQLKAKGRYSGNYTFFDEVELKTGATVKWVMAKETIEQFKTRCEKGYLASMDLLKQYAAKKIISEDFFPYAEAEINARYVAWLCEPLALLPREELPKNYFDRADTLNFQSEDFAARTDFYLTAANLYVYYIFNRFDTEDWYSGLVSQFESIRTKYKGNIRDQLLSWLVTDYAARSHPSFDSVYDAATALMENKYILDITNRKIAQVQHAKPVKRKIEYSEVLDHSFFMNTAGEGVSMKQALDDSLLTIIDCWATWCGPCIAQAPAMDAIAKKYKARVNVVYLSFDKDEEKWKNYIRKNNKFGTKSFLINNTFESAFSQYFNLTEIPRYILLSPKGAIVLNNNMPLPALTKKFEAELNKFIQTKL